MAGATGYMTDSLAPFFPPYFHLWHIPATFFSGLIGEGYATVVGSGGVLIQFVLAALGMPIVNVVATDLAGCVGADVGIIVTSAPPKRVWNKRKLLLQLAVPLFLGGIAGTLFLIYVPSDLLKYILIVGLSLLLMRLFVEKRTILRALEDVHVDMKHYPLLFILLFVLGVYGNISGVGSGTFLKLVLLSILRISVVDSISVGSIITMPSSIFSFVMTALAGLIMWPYCLTLWVGTFIGGRYATKFAQKVPDHYMRWLLIFIISLYLIWLLASLHAH
jgi:uncharacterized membrane protein YfcA